ncbi:MAG TPA: hypothetical protein VF435_07120 [Pyrinomonadaceae bacterium]
MSAIALLLVVLLYPIETTVVPIWKIRVIDEHGTGYEGIRIVEFWKHYSLELQDGENGEERWTDGSGVVEFPRRTIRLSILSRLARTSITGLLRYLHGSTGIHAYVMATGPQGIKDLNYDPKKPPPETLVLPRYETQDGNQ